MSMKSSYKFRVILVKYPFTDQSTFKVRPAIIINEKQEDTDDFFIIPLTSKTSNLKKGEFVLSNYKKAGLHIPSAVKRGIYTINKATIIKELKRLTSKDVEKLTQSIHYWLQL